jgi:hypothetical protein
MLTVTKQILISAPKESVSRYLQDLGNMTEYATKIDKVDLSEPEPEGGLVEVQGRFMGLTWRGAFKMEFTRDGGFRGEMVRGPLRKMVGGYHLRTVTGGTVVTRDEQYQFSLPLRPLTFLAKRWIERSVELELGAVKEGAERLHRQIQLEQIEKAG